ncbi:Mce associated membrane protein [Mycobacterium botniense]|uniref:Mce associated membrane protein n=1 Tax=Mycobacterium botniense TaxID=84962 RepID=A0A7I9XVT8_9MYCO|nr:Mce associated membrane protein [Mycobacterium botniense]
MTGARPPRRMSRWRPLRRARTASPATEDVDPASSGADVTGCDAAAETDAGLPSAQDPHPGTERQSLSGTDESHDTTTDSASSEPDDIQSDETHDAADHSGAEAAPEVEQTGATRTRQPAGKRLVLVVGAAAALFVGSAAFAGAAVQPYLADQATVATKLKIARTAANAITTLWTYTPENMDTLADRAGNYLTGDFEAQYRKFVDRIAAANKQAKITNNTQVTGAAVESLNGSEAIAIVYTNTTSTSPLTKGIPSLKYLSYRLFMKREHARWLVTRMTTITALDLTPRL